MLSYVAHYPAGKVSRSDEPTMPLLLAFHSRSGKIIKIAERIAECKQFSTSLLSDYTGVLTAGIREEYKDSPLPTRAAEAIFQKWLKEEGRLPVTWTTLVATMREVPTLSRLVGEIEEHFGKSVIMFQCQ